MSTLATREELGSLFTYTELCRRTRNYPFHRVSNRLPRVPIIPGAAKPIFTLWGIHKLWVLFRQHFTTSPSLSSWFVWSFPERATVVITLFKRQMSEFLSEALMDPHTPITINFICYILEMILKLEGEPPHQAQIRAFISYMERTSVEWTRIMVIRALTCRCALHWFDRQTALKLQLNIEQKPNIAQIIVFKTWDLQETPGRFVIFFSEKEYIKLIASLWFSAMLDFRLFVWSPIGAIPMPMPTLIAYKVTELLMRMRKKNLMVSLLPLDRACFFEREILDRNGHRTGITIPVGFRGRIFWYERRAEGGRLESRAIPVQIYEIGPFEEVIKIPQVSNYLFHREVFVINNACLKKEHKYERDITIVRTFSAASFWIDRFATRWASKRTVPRRTRKNGSLEIWTDSESEEDSARGSNEDSDSETDSGIE